MSPERNFLDNQDEQLAFRRKAAALLVCWSAVYNLQHLPQPEEQEEVIISVDPLDVEMDWQWGELNGQPISGGWEGKLPAYTSLMSGKVVDGKPELDFDPRVPKQYQDAITAGVEHPIVRLAIEEETVDSFEAVASFGDNGEFEVDKDGAGSVEFRISSGITKDRLYLTDGDFVAVSVHEAVHGLTERWYEAYRKGKVTGDPVLDQRIAALDAACRDVRDPIFASFIADRRDELGVAFGLASRNFSQEADADRYPTEVVDYPAQMRHFADALGRAKQVIEADSPDVYAGLERPVCDSPELSDIAEELIPNTVDLTSDMEDYDLFLPLFSEQMNIRHVYTEAYACIQDGPAIAEAFHPGQESTAGHPFDSPTETIASVISILAVNPAYIPDCLDDMDDMQQRRALERLVRESLSVSGYVYPELIEILRQNTEAAAVIDRYR